MARDVAEDPAEGAQAVPTGLEGDVDDWEVGVTEQGPGALDATGEEVTMWGETERGLEGSRKVRCGDTAHASELVHRPWTLRIAVHGILGSEKPSQQCRVLARLILRHPDGGDIVSEAGQLRGVFMTELGSEQTFEFHLQNGVSWSDPSGRCCMVERPIDGSHRPVRSSLHVHILPLY